MKKGESRPSAGATGRIALIAGSGRLPVDVAMGLERAGQHPLVILVDGEAIDARSFEPFETVRLAPGQIGDLLPLLRRNGIDRLVMAGGVSRRPSLKQIKWSLGLLPYVPRVVRALAGGDNRVLSVLVTLLEESGIQVLGAHQVVPDLLAASGRLTRAGPSRSDERDLNAAREAALAIGRLDIGQAAVAIGGRVVALEGVEGTDGLLDRVKDLRGHGRLAGRHRGVLVKCAKPGQEERADLPAIGPSTVEGAHAAGLAGIGIEAGRSFVLEFVETVARADALGLFIVGLGEAKAQ